MSAKNLLDQLRVNNPCSASWDSMIGNNEFRFCEHCSLSVHNFTAMTRKEVELLLAKSNGRLCVRYEPRRDGSVKTLPAVHKLHRITRRASQLAASAFSATLAITASTATAQPLSVAPDAAVASKPIRVPLMGGSVVGVVTDQAGAVITSASVNLTNDQSGISFYSSVNMSGEFRFEGLPAGLYSLRIEAPGFTAVQAGSFYVSDDNELRMNQTMRVASPEAEVEIRADYAIGGVVAFVAPADPFIRAAQEDNLEELMRLLPGKDVNTRDKDTNTTALEHAVRNANREMVQLLISAGARVSLKNGAGQTVMMMMDVDATTDLVWDLINAGGKVNSKDNDGETPLMTAAAVNNVDLVRTLLDAGAKIEARNERKQTALIEAAAQGNVNVIRALLMAGAEVNATDSDGKNALWYALESGHHAAVRLLRSQGAIEVTKDEDQEK